MAAFTFAGIARDFPSISPSKNVNNSKEPGRHVENLFV